MDKPKKLLEEVDRHNHNGLKRKGDEEVNNRMEMTKANKRRTERRMRARWSREMGGQRRMRRKEGKVSRLTNLWERNNYSRRNESQAKTFCVIFYCRKNISLANRPKMVHFYQ